MILKLQTLHQKYFDLTFTLRIFPSLEGWLPQADGVGFTSSEGWLPQAKNPAINAFKGLANAISYHNFLQ